MSLSSSDSSLSQIGDFNRGKIVKFAMFVVNAPESGLFINHSNLEP